MRYYSNEAIARMLEKLDIEQIREIEKEFKERYPENHIYPYLCNLAIGRIQGKKMREEFVDLIEKRKSAPSGATNTEQGNATR